MFTRRARQDRFAGPPGGRALTSGAIEDRPEVVCEWMEGLSAPEFRAACAWAALRRCPGMHVIEQAALRIPTDRRRVRAFLAVDRLAMEDVDGGPRAVDGGVPVRLSDIMGAAGVPWSDPGCRNLESSAKAAVRAGFVSRRLLEPLVGERAIAHFVAITQAADFAVNQGDEAFAFLCRVARDADLPFERMARSVVSPMEVQDAGEVSGREPYAWLGTSTWAMRLRHALRNNKGWRYAVGMVLCALLLFVAVVLAAVIVQWSGLFHL